MNYHIVDKQVYSAAPSPATEWNCQHTVSTPGGPLTQEQISLMLKGPPEVDKRALLVLAAAIAEERTGHFRGQLGENVFLRDIAVIDHVHDSRVEMQLRLQHRVNAQGALGTAGERFAAPLELDEYDPLQSPHPPGNYGPDTPTGAFLMRWQNPCGGDHAIGQEQSITDSTQGEYASSTRTLASPTPLGEYPASIASSHRTHPYLLVDLDIKYNCDENKVALPIANSYSSSQSSGGKTQAIVTLAAPTALRTVDFAAERVGSEPDVPSAIDNNSSDGPRETLLSRQITPSAPELMPDGVTLLYRVKCRYLYALDRPPEPDEGFKAGSLPWDTTTPEENRLSGDAFTSGIDG